MVFRLLYLYDRFCNQVVWAFLCWQGVSLMHATLMLWWAKKALRWPLSLYSIGILRLLCVFKYSCWGYFDYQKGKIYYEEIFNFCDKRFHKIKEDVVNGEWMFSWTGLFRCSTQVSFGVVVVVYRVLVLGVVVGDWSLLEFLQVTIFFLW